MKIRADQLMVKKGVAPSLHQAGGLILAGKVFFRKGRIEKAGQLLDEEEEIRIETGSRFVSRGGEKLDGALRAFGLDVAGRVCLDVGASTGGFTDCLLQRRARKVYAVDVGYGQFHEKLRLDRRVVLFEKTNFRHFSPTAIPEPVALAVADVSFISLTKILPRLREFLEREGEALVLVKPQFELLPREVQKGVVRSALLQEKAVAKVAASAREAGFAVVGRTPSPLKGPKGNQEYFLHMIRRPAGK